MRIEREQALAFRLNRHGLSRRSPAGSLVDVAGRCGIRNTPPGSAITSLLARMDLISGDHLARALADEKSLVQVRSIRAAPLIVPTADIDVFTAGLLSVDDESLRGFLGGGASAIDTIGLTATDFIDRVALALDQILGKRHLPFRQLSSELTATIGSRLPTEAQAAWHSDSPHARDQTLGEAAVHFALYAVALTGAYCYVPGAGRESWFARTESWIGPRHRLSNDDARRELLRRYLRCYGPSTVQYFAEWTGVTRPVADLAWRLLAPEIVECRFGGRSAWLLAADLPAMESPPTPTGARLLPPNDAWVATRDRATLVADAPARRQVWRAAGAPGVALIDGEVRAIWRMRARNRVLMVDVTPLPGCPPLSASEMELVAAEAGPIGRARGCVRAEVTVAD